MKEIWKEIPWYEDIYEASNLWRIKSLEREVWRKWWYVIQKEKILSPALASWYLFVNLRVDWIKKNWLVHRLIAISFMWYKEWFEVNHKNWIKTDNRLENLEWVTRSENLKHKYRVLKCKHNMAWIRWKLHSQSKRVGQYYIEWELIKEWDAMSDVERNLWVRQSKITLVCQGKRKTTGWFIWKYV